MEQEYPPLSFILDEVRIPITGLALTSRVPRGIPVDECLDHVLLIAVHDEVVDGRSVDVGLMTVRHIEHHCIDMCQLRTERIEPKGFRSLTPCSCFEPEARELAGTEKVPVQRAFRAVWKLQVIFFCRVNQIILRPLEVVRNVAS